MAVLSQIQTGGVSGSNTAPTSNADATADEIGSAPSQTTIELPLPPPAPGLPTTVSNADPASTGASTTETSSLLTSLSSGAASTTSASSGGGATTGTTATGDLQQLQSLLTTLASDIANLEATSSGATTSSTGTTTGSIELPPPPSGTDTNLPGDPPSSLSTTGAPSTGLATQIQQLIDALQAYTAQGSSAQASTGVNKMG